MPSHFKLPEGLRPSSIDVIPVLSSTLSNLQIISSINSTSATSQNITGTGLLTLKDVPPATDELKKQLQKACGLIEQLPDMDRTIAEQQQEITELENKIARQREIINSLREIAEASKREFELMACSNGRSPSPMALTAPSPNENIT
ncbi:hypothetical protein K3495_g660 [Podosphaera aphanis]|nr:hypothetical protein K3495_g660 [Podosphaera aphanis]